ncbi:MAG: response regulator [Scytolyngbya sp. HA4215-MV1]|nr:response regulator [Scytolyngbya sp. HA4215-MV1]
MNHVQLVRPIEILLVEDSPSDADLTLETLSAAKVLNNLHVVEDRAEAMKFLCCQGTYQGVPCPDLILLDLNLPKKDGREVLAEIKADPQLKTIPVVILTTSAAEIDILKPSELDANCYITKPVAFAEFVHIIELIESFWLAAVKCLLVVEMSC